MSAQGETLGIPSLLKRRPQTPFKSRNPKLAIRYLLRFFLTVSLSLEELTTQAQQLPKDQRFTLAYRILKGTEPSEDSTNSIAWETTIEQRIADFKAGKMESIPASDVFAGIDQALEK